MTPQDYYTIYNINPTLKAGNVGGAATIAILGSGPFDYGTVTNGQAAGGDVTTFRNLFGITTPLNLTIQSGDVNFPCTVASGGDSGESALDVEWAGTTAPGATLIFESCEGSSDGSGFDFQTEVQALVDANVADIVTSSIGFTEGTLAGTQAFETAFAQGATQGQTFLSAQGDSGSDDADFGNPQGTSGLNVDYPGSSPLVLSVGGTDFQDLYDVYAGSSTPQSTYWSATNSQFYGDALSYVPETAWNDSCASPIVAATPQYGGAPGETTATFCDSQYGQHTGGGGGGGISMLYAQPSWQTGTPGLSTSITNRVTPDVSMFASSGGYWGHEIVVCDTGGGQPCTSPSTFGYAGGTSFAAPSFSGILGLLKTSTGSRQGLVQPALYALAKAQYSAGTACYANGQTANTGITSGLPASTCIFNDVTTSGNNNECAAGTPNCFTNPGASYGVLTSSGNTSTFVDAYAAGAKYDIATGLGSVNVTNLLAKWNTAFTSSTTLKANPTSIASTASTTLTATVTGGQPAGSTGQVPALSGSVTFNAGGVKVGSCTLSGGTCSATVAGSALKVGANSITATFSGSGTYPSSTSSIITVTVTSVTPPPPPPPANPTFNPAGGTFTVAQSVVLSDAASGSSIYYTTNGTTPSNASTPYTTAISVPVTETIEAIAYLNGVASSVASATYTINSSISCNLINYGNGFSSTGLTLNGGAKVTNKLLQLTDGNTNEARSAFFTSEVPVNTFVTDFTFQLLSPVADGFTFVIQGNSAKAVGGNGGQLGYGGIGNSAALKFDLYNNSGEGVDSTGLYFNGASPSTPSINLAPSGINLHSGHVFAAHISYVGQLVSFTLTDTVTKAVYSTSAKVPSWTKPINAWVGFTGGTGKYAATQNILSWTYSSGSSCSAQ